MIRTQVLPHRALAQFGGLLSGLALLAVSASTQAAPVTWTFVGATAAGTSQTPFSYDITGSFDFDASTVSFSNIAVTLSGTGGYGGTYTQEKFAAPLPADNDSLWFVLSPDTDYSLDLSIRIGLEANMTDLGGSINLTTFYGSTCLSADCNSGLAVPVENGTFGDNVTGAVTSAPVPVPAALPLFVGGAGLLGWLGRRRSKLQQT